jgi:hypothetical protein
MFLTPNARFVLFVSGPTLIKLFTLLMYSFVGATWLFPTKLISNAKTTIASCFILLIFNAHKYRKRATD